MCALLSSCSESLAPDHATPFTPDPAVYRVWWQDMETCSGRTGDYFTVRWYSAPEDEFPHAESRLVFGVWRAPHDIFLVDYGLDNQRLVSHEILHDLTQSTEHGPVFDTCGVR